MDSAVLSAVFDTGQVKNIGDDQTFALRSASQRYELGRRGGPLSSCLRFLVLHSRAWMKNIPTTAMFANPFSKKHSQHIIEHLRGDYR